MEETVHKGMGASAPTKRKPVRTGASVTVGRPTKRLEGFFEKR